VNEPKLTEEERAVYAWQISVPGLGEEGQRRLKGATVLVSRCGGVGGNAAYQLAAAGIGRLILAHAGNTKPSDLNRQLLMTHAGLGMPRVEQARARLFELNPRMEIVAVPENISEANVASLVGQADVVVSCAPLFQERLLMNREAVRQGKPLVDSAMFDFEAQLLTVVPGKTACLACLYPATPTAWERRFPVLGAVAGTIGCLGALEAIKVITNIESGLGDKLLLCDLKAMTFKKVRVLRRADCPVCGSAGRDSS
jgi:molybdopterin/thiamine biosynthesis adenylyltransferase